MLSIALKYLKESYYEKENRKFLKSLIVMLGAAIISVVMCGCSSATTEEKLVGAWKKKTPAKLSYHIR